MYHTDHVVIDLGQGQVMFLKSVCPEISMFSMEQI